MDMSRSSTVVVVGASAGGLEPLRQLIAGIPRDFPAPILVAVHLAPDRISHIPEILARSGAVPVRHPKDGERMEPGIVYVAPPDHHLLVDRHRLAVKKGPKENRFRPSIDALFRSAAYHHRANVVAVVLSGSLDDGTSGLWTVKNQGGTAIVQDPDEARYESMPLNALNQVHIDYRLKAAEMGAVLSRLAAESGSHSKHEPDRKLHIEVNVAATANAFQQGIMDVGVLTPFTCPECDGALVLLTEGRIKRFRCHTGHGFSASALLAGVTEAVGESLWKVTKSLEESVMLLEHMAAHYRELGEAATADRFLAKAKDTKERAAVLQKMTLQHEHLSEEAIRGDDDS
jgi:two-component system, chemotaxis family, protein-glutamate methylesterase/glutaminase